MDLSLHRLSANLLNIPEMLKFLEDHQKDLLDWLKPIVPQESSKRNKNEANLRQELIDTRQKCSSSEEKFFQLLMSREHVKYELSEVTKRLAESEGIIANLLEEVSRLQKELAADKREIEEEMVEKAPKCPVCLLPFDKNVVPNIGSCGHSVCHICTVFLKNCPICRATNSFLRPKTNFLAAEFTNNFSFSCNEQSQLHQRILGEDRNDEEIDEGDDDVSGDEDYLDDEEWDEWSDEWADVEDF